MIKICDISSKRKIQNRNLFQERDFTSVNDGTGKQRKLFVSAPESKSRGALWLECPCEARDAASRKARKSAVVTFLAVGCNQFSHSPEFREMISKTFVSVL